MSILSADGLSAGYGKKADIIHDISFTLNEHSLTALLGTNGCGKTTLIKTICGMIPYKGEISVDGRDIRTLSVRELSKLCSYIPQRSGISIDISALDAVLMGFSPDLGILNYPDSEMKKKAELMLERVGLGDRINENFLHLSEGQKQLCILARAMVRKCRLMLMDEPESALDFGGRYKMLGMVRDIVDTENCSALVTLHDPQLALNTCNEILLMKDGQLVSVLHPDSDSINEMEERMSGVFGPLSITECKSKKGKRHLVLIKE